MELRIYDEQLNRIGTVEEYASLLWTRKYYEPGNFKIELPMTEKNLEYFHRGRILRKTDAKEAGVIEYIQKMDTPKKKIITAQGRFLSSYLDRRLIKGTHTFSGTSEEVMREATQIVDPIPLFTLGELKGYTDQIQKQATYKNLLEIEKQISKTSGHGFILYPDYVEKRLIFEIYDGLDKSKNQNERPRVIFSEDYSNLNEVTYTDTDTLYKNVFYIAGEGEGEDRIIVTIGDDEHEGLERREVFIDAKDLRKEDMTEEEYKDLLLERGRERAESYLENQSIDSKVNPVVNFTYRKHYDLGDIVTIEKPTWGVNLTLRITELMEQYIGGGMSVIPTFGEPLPTEWSTNNDS